MEPTADIYLVPELSQRARMERLLIVGGLLFVLTVLSARLRVKPVPSVVGLLVLVAVQRARISAYLAPCAAGLTPSHARVRNLPPDPSPVSSRQPPRRRRTRMRAGHPSSAAPPGRAP